MRKENENENIVSRFSACSEIIAKRDPKEENVNLRFTKHSIA